MLKTPIGERFYPEKTKLGKIYAEYTSQRCLTSFGIRHAKRR